MSRCVTSIPKSPFEKENPSEMRITMCLPATVFPPHTQVPSAAIHCTSLQSNSVSAQACGSLASQVSKAAGASAPGGYFKIKGSQKQI